jgi:hypothetical protein
MNTIAIYYRLTTNRIGITVTPLEKLFLGMTAAVGTVDTNLGFKVSQPGGCTILLD